jgi:hypothetical protein
MVYRGVPKYFPLIKIIGTSILTNLFSLLFPLLLYTRTFFATSLCRKNALPFSCQSLIRESFSRSLTRYNFSPFLNKCANYSYLRILKPCLTLRGVSLVLWRRKADNEQSNLLFYGPSPLNSQHLHFQFTIASLLKFFVRSRRDWEKKCREGSRQELCIHISMVMLAT